MKKSIILVLSLFVSSYSIAMLELGTALQSPVTQVAFMQYLNQYTYNPYLWRQEAQAASIQNVDHYFENIHIEENKRFLEANIPSFKSYNFLNKNCPLLVKTFSTAQGLLSTSAILSTLTVGTLSLLINNPDPQTALSLIAVSSVPNLLSSFAIHNIMEQSPKAELYRLLHKRFSKKELKNKKLKK